MSKRSTFVISNRGGTIDPILPALQALEQRHCLTPRCSYNLHLVLDEVITNIFSYAFDDEGVHSVLVELRADEETVELTVEDGGRPFNPLQSPEPDVNLPPELRAKPVGGLGIHLVRKLMDEVEYERREGKNVLTMRKIMERESEQ